MIEKGFDKKIFTAKLFFSDLGFLFWNFPKIIGAMRDQKMTRTFVEKIMTVTSAVNGCIYCSWFHAKQAVSSGISEEEVKNMMELQFHADAKEYEIMALLYAQHFAETNRQPDSEMTKKLFDYYGDKTAKNIILVIRIISFGNLYGNTWDAVISRLKGKPAPNSNILFELFYFLMNFLIMIPAMLTIKRDKEKSKGQKSKGSGLEL
jgi:AhpD family alkylhydroperoxidase